MRPSRLSGGRGFLRVSTHNPRFTGYLIAFAISEFATHWRAAVGLATKTGELSTSDCKFSAFRAAAAPICQ